VRYWCWTWKTGPVIEAGLAIEARLTIEAGLIRRTGLVKGLFRNSLCFFWGPLLALGLFIWVEAVGRNGNSRTLRFCWS